MSNITPKMETDHFKRGINRAPCSTSLKIFAGIRLGLGVSIILVVAAEMVVGKTGLGARLYLAGQILETEQVFAVLIVLAALGIIVTKIQDIIDVWLSHWRND